MNNSLTDAYHVVQLAACVLLVIWFIQRKNKKTGGLLRSLTLFALILSPVLLYLSVRVKIGLPVRIYLIASAVVFLVFGADKMIAASDSNRSRVPENTLVLLSVFGILGGISGMLVFHHKIKKAKFQYTMPVIALAELVILGLVKMKFYHPAAYTAVTNETDMIFALMTSFSCMVLAVILIRTFILVRLMLTIPIAVGIGVIGVGLIYPASNALTFGAMLKEYPMPFLGICILTFVILEIIVLNTKFFTSADQVRLKTDHSKDKKN